jgi:outer membrane protein assembly factor BamB
LAKSGFILQTRHFADTAQTPTGASMKNTMTVIVGFALVFGSAASAQDWPQWRGPNRDAKVAGFKAPATWPKELTKKWKKSVGEGLASPALVGDKIYVFTRQGGDEVITCLNASDSKEVWTDKYAAEQVRGVAAGGKKGSESFTGPRSSPAVGEGKVCTFGVAGIVSCLDAAKGTKLWRKDTKAKPMFFTSTSPIIADGLCIVHVGSRDSGELTAFDLASGEVKWKWSGDAPSYGSPILTTIDGKKQVVLLTARNLVGVNAADGKLAWKTAFSQGRYQTATPVADGDMVICSGTAFTVGKEGDEVVAKKSWKGQAPHMYNTPVLKEGLLFGLSGMGRNMKLYCQDAKTGDVRWNDDKSRGECGTVVDAGSVLIALTSNSELVVFKPSGKEFAEIVTYKVADTPTWALPIISGNRVIVKDRDSVTLWTIE